VYEKSEWLWPLAARDMHHYEAADHEEYINSSGAKWAFKKIAYAFNLFTRVVYDD